MATISIDRAATGAGLARRWVAVFVGGLGLVNIGAGLILVLEVGLNLVEGLIQYGAGAVGMRGAGTIFRMAVVMTGYDPLVTYVVRSPTNRLWGHPPSIRLFFAYMTIVHLVAGMGLILVGVGLRRRWWWAGRAEMIGVGLAMLAGVVNGVRLVAERLPEFGYETLAVSLAVGLPTLGLLATPAARAIFRGEPVEPIRLNLPLRFLGWVLLVPLVFGMLMLLSQGPLVEIGWLALGAVERRFP